MAPIFRSWHSLLVLVSVALVVSFILLVGAAPQAAIAPEPAPSLTPLTVAQVTLPTLEALVPTVRAAPSRTSTATASPAPPTATATPSGPTTIPTPSPRPAGTPWRVGLQVGHLRSNELPDELARLRTSTGARYGRTTEADLNLDIAQRVQKLLEAQGIVVDLLPATVPPSYDADAFIAIHADGSPSERARGWKIATPWRASQASKQLLAAVAATYGPATGLPEDVGGITFNMRGYYAFSYRRHTHAIARTTPAIIVEMGFMTSPADRDVLFGQPDRVARGIAEGIVNYLRGRDPNDGAALLPPEFPMLRALPTGAVLRAAPRDNARVLMNLTPDQRLAAFSKENGWYEVFVRGEWRTLGWVREDQVEATNEPLVIPTATNP